MSGHTSWYNRGGPLWGGGYAFSKPTFGAPSRYRQRRMVRRVKTKSFSSKVKNIIDNKIENRYIDTTLNSVVAVLGASEVTFLTGCAQGNDHDERSGDIMHVTSVQIFGDVLQDATQLIDSHSRIILVRSNNNTDGAIPALVEFLVADDTNSLRAIDDLQSHNFTKIWDYNFVVRTPESSLRTLRKRQIIKYYKKFSTPKKCTYDGDGATVADAENGHLFLITMTDQVAADAPRFELNIRVTFKDN